MSDSIQSDFTIIVKSKEFKVHKPILSARSPVFKKMFETNMKEAEDNKVEINDIDPLVFEQLLIFIYSGSTENLNYFAMDLFAAADKVCLSNHIIFRFVTILNLQYGIDELKKICENYISTELNYGNLNEIDVFKFANLYSCHELKEKALRLIKE